MRISVIGCGYVGMSLAVLLAQKHEVVCVDVMEERVENINNKTSPIRDELIEEYLKGKSLNIKATLDLPSAVKDADIVIISVPTNYDDINNRFDTHIVTETCALSLKCMKKEEAFIVIKSTIPVGYTKETSEKLGTDRILFSPEFLREGKALYDNLYPSRIVVGTDGSDMQTMQAQLFAATLKECSLEEDVPVQIIGSSEAEALKLFANTYLAMRVAFFNELDTFAGEYNLNAKEIIDGVCTDPRIGNFYNNPSFGYGGYCLPKDTKQLYRSYGDAPQKLMKAVVASNETRKKYIYKQIVQRMQKENIKKIGIYKLAMKSGSDNYRASAIIDIIHNLMIYKTIEVIIYEPTYDGVSFMGRRVIKDIDELKACDLIVANRMSSELSDVADKVYTRDIFGEN